MNNSNPDISNQIKKEPPNLFSIAPSELSQDAMIAWLISCADPQIDQDPEIRCVAERFISMLLGKKDVSFSVKRIKVGRQKNHIDVWAIINDDIFLVIEDKTNTSVHGDQLERYKESVQKTYGFHCSQLCFVYLKTGNEPLSTINEIKEKGYNTVFRKDIIDCLDKYHGNHFLITTYLQYLKKLEDDTESFKELPVSKWQGYAWEGFFKALEPSTLIRSWGYVPNPAGGFQCAWGYPSTVSKEVAMYFHVEENKFCFKIWYEGDSSKRSLISADHSKKLLEFAKEKGFFEIVRPPRIMPGNSMTIAIVQAKDFYGDGIVNIDDIFNKLKKYWDLIVEYCKQESANQTII